MDAEGSGSQEGILEEPKGSLQSLSPASKLRRIETKTGEGAFLQIDSRQVVRTFDPNTSLESISAQLSPSMTPAELEITRINREILERMKKTRRDIDINVEVTADAIRLQGQENTRSNYSPTRSHCTTSQGHVDAADAEDWVKTQLEMIGDFILPRTNVIELMAKAGLEFDNRSHAQDLPITMESLSRVGLDRATLERLQMPKELVDRLYRALYVYTKGFHSIIGDIVRHIPSPVATQMSSNIWLVFLLLLEQCDSGRYEMALSKLRQAFVEWRQEREASHQSEKFSSELQMQKLLVELEHVKEEKEKERDHNKVLETELERQLKLIREGQTQQTNALESNRRLELEIRLREEEIDRLSKELDDARRDFELAHSERLHVLTEKIASVEENQTLKNQVERFREEKFEMAKRMNEAIVLNETRVIELETLKHSISEIAREKDRTIQENFQLSQQQAEFQTAIASLTRETESLEIDISTWQLRHENDVLTLKAVEEQYQSEITQNAAHSQRIAILLSEMNDAKVEVKIMERKNQLLAQEIKNAEIRPQDKLQIEILLNEKSQSQREIERLQEMHRSDQESIQNLQLLIEGLEKDYQHLKGMFSASQQAFVRSERKCEQIRQECTLIENRLHDSENALSVLSEHHVLAEEKAKDQITSLQEEVCILLVKLQQGRLENEKHSMTTAQAVQNVRQLREEIESWEIKCSKLNQMIEQLKDEKEEFCHVHYEKKAQVANFQTLFTKFLQSVKQLLELVKHDKFPADEALREIIHLAKNSFATFVNVDGLLEEEDELIEYHDDEVHSPLTETMITPESNLSHDVPDTLDKNAAVARSRSVEKRQSYLMERCVYIMSRYRKSKLETQVLQLTEEAENVKNTITAQERQIQTQMEQLTSLIQVNEEHLFMLRCAERDKESLSLSLGSLKEKLREEKARKGLVDGQAHELRLELHLTVDECAHFQSLYRHTRQCWDRQVAQMEDIHSRAGQIGEYDRLMRSLRRTIAVEAIVSSSDAWTATTASRDAGSGRTRISKTVLKSNNFMQDNSRGYNHETLWKTPQRMTDISTLLLPKAGDFNASVVTHNAVKAAKNVHIAAERPLARRRDPSPRQQQRIASIYKQTRNVSFEERVDDDDSFDSEDEEEYLPVVQKSNFTASVSHQRSKSSQHAFVNTAIEMIRPIDSQQENERTGNLECIGHKTTLTAKSLVYEDEEFSLSTPFRQSSSLKAHELRQEERAQPLAFVPAILYPLVPR